MKKSNVIEFEEAKRELQGLAPENRELDELEEALDCGDYPKVEKITRERLASDPYDFEAIICSCSIAETTRESLEILKKFQALCKEEKQDERGKFYLPVVSILLGSEYLSVGCLRLALPYYQEALNVRDEWNARHYLYFIYVVLEEKSELDQLHDEFENEDRKDPYYLLAQILMDYKMQESEAFVKDVKNLAAIRGWKMILKGGLDRKLGQVLYDKQDESTLTLQEDVLFLGANAIVSARGVSDAIQDVLC